jgi:EpsI family protein
MLSRTQTVRFCVSVCFLLSANLLLRTVSHGEPVVMRQPLWQLPYELGSWHGEERPLQREVLDVVKAAELLNRLYVDSSGHVVLLYVGYYESQRTGGAIHSPKNCLPGAGWQPMRWSLAKVSLSSGDEIAVNETLIEKDQEKQLVFYWYQGRGRVIADEFSAKFWLISDAISRNRTDGALVRLVTPVSNSDREARTELTDFAQVLLPYLDREIPQ